MSDKYFIIQAFYYQKIGWNKRFKQSGILSIVNKFNC